MDRDELVFIEMGCQMRVSKKVALVTGAAQGIGKIIAHTLAKEGAFVFVCDLAVEEASNVAEDICNKGGEAVSIEHDVTNIESWINVENAVKKRFERLDIMVNNAGIHVTKPFSDTTLDEWRQIQSVNVESIFLGCQQFKELLANGGQSNFQGASIINISSIAGIVSGPNQMAYNTSKAAVRHMSKSLAIEFSALKHNVRVNSIHPGFIQTPMLERLLEHGNKASSGPEDAAQRAILSMIPLGRVGTAQDVANGALFLASDDSGYINATELIIDGGVIAR